jgi:SAM-dependent methyltransferase
MEKSSGTHLQVNQRAWDERVRRGERHTRMAQTRDLANPLPILDPENWLGGNVRGKKVLCLASGGGLQSAFFAAAGAIVTVVDLSAAMLEQDRAMASKNRFQVLTVQTSMDDLSMFANGSFEIVLQPVSTCYVADVAPVFREVARVLREGGLYISQHKQPANLQAESVPSGRGYAIIEPAERTGPLPPVLPCLHREADTLEFLHSWTDLIGGICRGGFAIEDLVEPNPAANALAAPGTFEHRCAFLPPYAKIKARRLAHPSPALHLK